MVIRCDENMPELTDAEIDEERRSDWEAYYDDTHPCRNAEIVLTPLGQAMRRLCATKLAVIAERRRTRAAQEEHLRRWNEMHEIAAATYDADAHGDLTWREEYGIP